MGLVVTGASGQLGRLAVAALLERVAASELIAVTRTPDRLADLAAKGVRVRYGDFTQPASLVAAFAGGERVLVISSMPPGEVVSQHRAAFESAANAGVRHVIYTSFPNPTPQNSAPPAAYQRASEHALQAAGIAWTVLRNALYAELRVGIAPKYIRDGRWYTNAGAAAHAFISRADCARAAAGALTTPGHEGKVYEITGPELIDAAGYTALLHEFGGRAVTCIEVADDEFERYRGTFQADVGNESFIELYTGTGRAIREGHMSQLSSAAQTLAGRAPAPLRELFARYYGCAADGTCSFAPSAQRPSRDVV